MHEGCPVELRMVKSLLTSTELDEVVYSCEIKKYIENEEEICLLLENADLSKISLDAEYECHIWGVDGIVICQGRIVERYRDKRGNNFRFRIENGFYKNNLN